jgi:hypothetical protein
MSGEDMRDSIRIGMGACDIALHWNTGSHKVLGRVNWLLLLLIVTRDWCIGEEDREQW